MAVIGIEEKATGAFNAAVTHLTLTYSPAAPETVPRRLVLKRNLDAGWAVAGGRRRRLHLG